MEGAVAEMERSGASQETIDRQKRILSRLLDAQRSLRRRDYKRDRRSTPGEAYAREAPGALPEDLTKATRELREDLLRAMQRDYPAEYRELIRAYFEGLSQDLAREGRGGGTE
jgi:DNA-directed RNA polymerase specialized sigma24 family protein